VYVSQNMLVDSNVQKVIDIMRRAKTAGYNGIVLDDYKFNVLDRVDQRYFKNMDAVKRASSELGMDIYPAVFPLGYSEGVLTHDPNLAEGLPVRDALFVARDGKIDLLPDPSVVLANGDFEESNGDKLAGWSMQDGIGKCTFVDKSVRYKGSQSLRMENIGTADPQHGNGRIAQIVNVSPYRQYHLSAWVKTDNFETPGNVNVFAMGLDGRMLSYNTIKVERTQDWRQIQVIFNSLGNKQVRIYLGVWDGKGGKLWWDDVRLEEVGLLNLIRREGCPLIVKSEDGRTFEEGRDFLPVKDERMGTVPWSGCYDVYHQPPSMLLAPNSRIKQGQRLRVSFFHTVIIYGGEVACCLTDPKVYNILNDQLNRVNSLLEPKGLLMSYDEIRVANWCDLCRARHLTPGRLLAESASKCTGMIRNLRPDAKIFVWSDMFDPNHNAHDDYYLVNGTWAGSWEGLPKDVIVVNWNGSEKRKETLDWFAKQGHAQILAGYYDASPERIRGWLDDAKTVPGVVSVMYTTWQNRYDDLEAFAQAAFPNNR
jgi:hypothetical protein